MANRILVIENDPQNLKFLEETIFELGYESHTCPDPEIGINLAISEDYALILCNSKIPKLDGATLYKTIRQKNARLPILMLTSGDKEINNLPEMEPGSFDYCLANSSARELVERITNLLRNNCSL